MSMALGKPATSYVKKLWEYTFFPENTLCHDFKHIYAK